LLFNVVLVDIWVFEMIMFQKILNLKLGKICLVKPWICGLKRSLKRLLIF